MKETDKKKEKNTLTAVQDWHDDKTIHDCETADGPNVSSESFVQEGQENGAEFQEEESSFTQGAEISAPQGQAQSSAPQERVEHTLTQTTDSRPGCEVNDNDIDASTYLSVGFEPSFTTRQQDNFNESIWQIYNDGDRNAFPSNDGVTA